MLAVMDKQFGLGFLLRTYLGIGSNVVRPIQRHDRKSIGAERSVSSFRPFEVQNETTKNPPVRTFNPLGDKSKILQKLEEVAVELEKDMQKTGWTGRTVTLKYKLDTYQGGWLPNFVQRMLLICWIQFLLAPNHLIVG